MSIAPLGALEGEDKNMADPISSVGGRGPQGPRVTSSEVQKAADESKALASGKARDAAAAQDRVELSDAVKTANTEAVFDAEKVAELRQAIAEGQYPLDPKKIAESFAAIERLI